MQHNENALRAMPDIAKDAHPAVAGTLDWVGMDHIDVPVRFASSDGAVMQSPARVAAFVNLREPDVRGIHMSRLYQHVDHALTAEPLTPCSLRRLLREFLDSHAGLSDRAMLRVDYDHLLRRPALLSGNSGWKSYPVKITATMAQTQFTLELEVGVVYSSTCPCSAALARQLIQERFERDFGRDHPITFDVVRAWLGTEQGICATPHSQRSEARVRVKLAAGFDFPIVELIDTVENALMTPVQTVVKREDEQEFARLNGENLMFCEDAARRIQNALAREERIVDFHVRAAHFESLHPHDAVAVTTKGVGGGYTANGSETA